MKSNYNRVLKAPEDTFFLFGPRNTGKSTLLRDQFKNSALEFDLLDKALFLELSTHPENLQARLADAKPNQWVWIDEVQKVPQLLDVVHNLIEKKKLKFALSGSSARKLKRGGANLLGGRALTRKLEGFSAFELDSDFDLQHSIQFGTLPKANLQRKSAADFLHSYLHTYIKEEIREEGLVRRLEPFLRFLEISGQTNGQVLNGQNIATEAAVPRSSIDNYFSILEDTLVGHFLPAFRPGAKVREVAHPKFYWFDPGVARVAAGLIGDPVDSLWMGTAFETLVFHELRVFNESSQKRRAISYYANPGDNEIDFVVETKKKTMSNPGEVVLIEAKAGKKWKREFEKPIRAFEATSKVKVRKKFGVYGGDTRYEFDGFVVLPYVQFVKELFDGKVF